MHAFVLAGGFATRLWPLTEKRAKPLLPLAGKPILTHLVEKIPADVPVTVSTNAAFGESFEAWAKELGRSNVSIVIEHPKSDDEKLGALGATAQWIEENNIEDDLLLLTGDNYLGFSMDAFLKKTELNEALLAAFDIKDLEQAKSFGTVIVEENSNRITAFEEKPKEPRSTLISTGCSLIPKEMLNILCDFAKKHPDNVGGIFEELLRQGKGIRCFTFSEAWFDIGSFDAYIEATKALVGDTILKGEAATLAEVTTNGSVVMGDGSTAQNSTLEDVVLFENCVVEDCVLSRCILDNGCVLRGVDLSGKMIREGTQLTRS